MLNIIKIQKTTAADILYYQESFLTPIYLLSLHTQIPVFLNGYNFLMTLMILVLKLFQIWQLGASLKLTFMCLWHDPTFCWFICFFRTSLPAAITSCYVFILESVIFLKGPWFLFIEHGLRNQDLGIGVFVADSYIYRLLQQTFRKYI
jgi:hypothetical protein